MNFPILSSIILLPSIGALFIFFGKETTVTGKQIIKYVALFTAFVNFIISIYVWYLFDNSTHDFQFVEEKEWLKGFFNYKVGIDGISILFIVLTTFITPLCIISANNNIKFRLKDFKSSALERRFPSRRKSPAGRDCVRSLRRRDCAATATIWWSRGVTL